MSRLKFKNHRQVMSLVRTIFKHRYLIFVLGTYNDHNYS